MAKDKNISEFNDKMGKLLDRAKKAANDALGKTESIVSNRSVMPGTRLRSGSTPVGSLNQAAKKIAGIEFDMKILKNQAKAMGVDIPIPSEITDLKNKVSVRR